MGIEAAPSMTMQDAYERVEEMWNFSTERARVAAEALSAARMAGRPQAHLANLEDMVANFERNVSALALALDAMRRSLN